MNCILKPVNETDKMLPISVKDEVIITGRGPSTKIKDSRCSRTQIEIIPDYNKRIVKIKQLGLNDSALNSIVIGIGLEVNGKAGDIVELLEGEYKYKIHFEDQFGKSVDDPKAAKIPKMFLPKVADEFKKDSILAKGNWEAIDDGKLLVYSAGENILCAKQKIAGFDMDGTIITTKSGRVFPTSEADWKFLYPTTILKLQNYFSGEPDAKFVIITNQAGIAKGISNANGIKKKIENITRQIGVPVIVFVATGKGEYRKPMTRTWKVLSNKYNEKTEPHLESSIFCGDAAGRKKDHAKSDRLFALNLGIPFLTPEEFFLKQKPQEYQMPIFNPQTFINNFRNGNNAPSNIHINFPHHQEMVILIGYPASGKSTFTKTTLLPKSYIHVNQDTLKSASKCMSTADNSLQNGQSVVVDNTNPDKKSRTEYIKLAKKHRVPVRCFKMNVDHAQALHNNKFREIAKISHATIPPVAFNSFKSKFQEPTKDEGFTEILDVNFVPRFDSELEEELYQKFLLEK